MTRNAKPADTRLQTYSWKLIRAYWRARLPLPCARCGGLISPGLYRIPIGDGKYKLNPASLHVGHITPRRFDTRTEWRIEDTQPEHVHCSSAAGARFGNGLRASKQARTELLDPRTSWTFSSDAKRW